MHQGPCVSRGLMVDLLRVSWSETWEMHQRYFASMARIIGCRNDCVGLRGARRHQRNDDALNARGLRVKEGSIDWSSICRRTEDASSEQSNPRVCVLSRALWGLRGSGGQGQQAGNGGLEGPRRGFEALVGAVGSHRATARAHPIARSVGNALSVGALCGCALCALCACALRALCGVCVRPIQEPRL